MYHTRVNDAVFVTHYVPIPHPSVGIHITCDLNTTSNDPLETRMYDLIVAPCHRVFGVNLTHAANNFDNTLEVHRLGDVGMLVGTPGNFVSIIAASNVTSV